jgi:hypothetical protein
VFLLNYVALQRSSSLDCDLEMSLTIANILTYVVKNSRCLASTCHFIELVPN